MKKINLKKNITVHNGKIVVVDGYIQDMECPYQSSTSGERAYFPCTLGVGYTSENCGGLEPSVFEEVYKLFSDNIYLKKMVQHIDDNAVPIRILFSSYNWSFENRRWEKGIDIVNGNLNCHLEYPCIPISHVKRVNWNTLKLDDITMEEADPWNIYHSVLKEICLPVDITILEKRSERVVVDSKVVSPNRETHYYDENEGVSLTSRHITSFGTSRNDILRSHIVSYYGIEETMKISFVLFNKEFICEVKAIVENEYISSNIDLGFHINGQHKFDI